MTLETVWVQELQVPLCDVSEVGEELRRGNEDGVRCGRSHVQEYHPLGPGIL